MAHTKFIYIPVNKTDDTTWNLCIKEVYEDDVYSYYFGDIFIFGVMQRFTQNDLKALYENGYFDLWLNGIDR